MRLYENHFSVRHLYVAIACYLGVAVLTFPLLVWWHQGSGALGFRLTASAATGLGPLAGGVMRGGQDCCVRFGLQLLPYCVVPFFIGLAVQFLRLPVSIKSTIFRWMAWVSGLTVWFLGGIVSYMHALS